MSFSLLRARHCFRFLSLCLIVLASAGCAPYMRLSENVFMMSPEQEMKLGLRLNGEAEKKFQLVDDEALNQYLHDVGDKVWLNSPQSAIPVKFFIINDPSINAFAIPGGSIYVHTGLIDAVDDEAELAAVMAHEIGHVVQRHSARSISRSTGFDVLQQVVLGSNGQATQMVRSMFDQLVTNGIYSQQDETDADDMAIGTLHRMGYDPTAMKTFFYKLVERYGDKDGLVALFASHPPTRQRIASVNKRIHTLPPKKYVRPITGLRQAQGRLETLGLATAK